MGDDAESVDWLRLIRFLTQYIVPGLVAVVMLGELLSAPLTGARSPDPPVSTIICSLPPSLF